MSDAIDAMVEDYKESMKRIEKQNAKNDAINHPTHYTQGGIECIEAIKASMTTIEFQGYLKGNCFKYLWRWRDKGGVQDLKKARVYLDWLIKTVDEVEE